MGVQFTNNALSTLMFAISPTATALMIDAATMSRFPQPLVAGDWFPVTLVDPSGVLEIVHCTARTDNVLTVTRGREGTTARAFPAYTTVEHRITAASIGVSDVDSLTKSTTGNRIGLYTYNLSQRPEPYITPRDLGALPNGGDVRDHILDCFDIAAAEGFNRVCLDGQGWYSNGYIEPPANIELFGRSRGYDSIEVRIIGGRTSPAIWVLKNDIYIHDLEIMVNDIDPIPGWPVSGFGETGTCITCSKYVPQGETPPAVSGFRAERLLLTRKAGTRVAGAIMPMAGTRHAQIRDIIIDGTKGQRHSIAVQAHWGCKSGVSEWDLTGPSMHPHQISFEDITIRGCDTGFIASAAYNIYAKNFDMDGVMNMVTILPGDEGNYLAPAAEKNQILKSIKLINFTGRNLVYQGVGNFMVSAIARGTSKGRTDADNPTQFAYTTMDAEIYMENFELDCGNGTVPDAVSVRYCPGVVTLKNFSVDGASDLAYDIENNSGHITLENCRANGKGGHIHMIANSHLVVDGCRIVNDYDKSHATTSWGMFLEGRTGRTATLASSILQGAEKLVLTAPFTYPVLKGDKVEIAPGNVCYATEAFSTAMSTIRVTPAPFAAAAGTVVTLDKRNHEVKVRNGTMFDNCYRGIEATDTVWLDVEETIIRRAGQYGILLPNNCKGRVGKTRFINGGQRYTFEPPAAGRDILIQTASHLDLRENHYGIDAGGVNVNLVVQSDSLAGFDRDSLFYRATSSPYANSCPLFEVVNPRDGLTLAKLDVRRAWTCGTRIGTVGAGSQSGINDSWYEVLPNRQVRLHAEVELTAKAAVTGKVTFNGVPIVPAKANVIGTAVMKTSIGLTGGLVIRTETVGVVSSQYVELMMQTATGLVNVTDAMVPATNAIFIFDIIYPF